MGAAESKEKLDEAVRENRRSINRSIRELDREALSLNRLEQQLLTQIKNQAFVQPESLQRVHAKQIVRVRRRRTALLACKSQLLGARLQLQQMQSMQQLQQHLHSSAQVLMKVNKSLNLPQLHTVMADFTHESQRLGLLEEMMTDVIDDAMADPAEEEEEEEIISQVLHSTSADLSYRVSEKHHRVEGATIGSKATVHSATRQDFLVPATAGPIDGGGCQQQQQQQGVQPYQGSLLVTPPQNGLSYSSGQEKIPVAAGGGRTAVGVGGERERGGGGGGAGATGGLYSSMLTGPGTSDNRFQEMERHIEQRLLDLRR
ncbi:snf7 family protein [Cystoisospora suis]|uniref:Snf7 family protein n=1 Tax=Cystoisospora suis TaxID=483139 RepID=A0A2C6KGH1_9APIC|nr:snf7 family protein [Cystoisospora suis]